VIVHPLLLAILALDVLALFFALYAARAYLAVLIDWAPDSATARQIALEASSEGASLAARYALGMFLVATLLYIVAISLVLPALVSGAMCGTGVLTAMQGFGQRALMLRTLALAGLWLWRTVDALDRSQPRQPTTPAVARFFLLALPALFLATLYTLRGLWALDVHQAVDCCQAVYATFGSVKEATTTLGISDAGLLALTATLGIAILALSLSMLSNRLAREARHKASQLLLGATLLWVPIATLTLVNVLSAYHYRVLHHHCPWCLFLTEHYAVGYPLYGALLTVLLETLAAVYATRALANPALQAAARRRQRRSLWVIVVAVLVYAALTAGPAITWRLSYGVWMHG
jgi:hypothetical protein